MSSNTINAKVKKDGRIIKVYKLNDCRYNIFLGDKISIEKVNNEQGLAKCRYSVIRQPGLRTKR